MKSGLVTVPGKLSDDLAPGTFNSILKQAQLKAETKDSEEKSQTEEQQQEEEN
ncbi:type II toxin-antitoxin system HicA family toxin [Calothrix sp. 336/3]|uniref:type II toxin-antitoxin system HicA family toxin n=1 Tax=Calothrix sp. 336/3 TaxID=1337936 RepID=UPI00118772B8|nr:type II toxin-antitoxin system HicA family toxin [Calothrix sp. 336/3]